jgi:hypothetical protein
MSNQGSSGRTFFSKYTTPGGLSPLLCAAPWNRSSLQRIRKCLQVPRRSRSPTNPQVSQRRKKL